MPLEIKRDVNSGTYRLSNEMGKFLAFRSVLLIWAKRLSMPHEDAEEIVNDSIITALAKFDEDRGNFECFCKVIIKNRIFTEKRKKPLKFVSILIDDDSLLYEINSKLYSGNESESRRFAENFLSKFRSKLEKNELLFFEELSKCASEDNDLNISEAARNIGLEPKKGWDLFRKIQRKAERHYEDISDMISGDFMLQHVLKSAVYDKYSRLENLELPAVAEPTIDYEQKLTPGEARLLERLLPEHAEMLIALYKN